MASPEAQTLLHEPWQRHLVDATDDGEALLYIDRHLVDEVTSPQAFEGLRLAGRKPWRRETVIATVDHDVPTFAAECTGIDAGADRFDAGFGGVGDCPYAPDATRNVCAEEILRALQWMSYDTGVDLYAVIAAAKRLPALIGHDTPSRLVKAGPRLDLHPLAADFDAVRERALARGG